MCFWTANISPMWENSFWGGNTVELQIKSQRQFVCRQRLEPCVFAVSQGCSSWGILLTSQEWVLRQSLKMCSFICTSFKRLFVCVCVCVFPAPSAPVCAPSCELLKFCFGHVPCSWQTAMRCTTSSAGSCGRRWWTAALLLEFLVLDIKMQSIRKTLFCWCSSGVCCSSLLCCNELFV